MQTESQFKKLDIEFEEKYSEVHNKLKAVLGVTAENVEEQMKEINALHAELQSVQDDHKAKLEVLYKSYTLDQWIADLEDYREGIIHYPRNNLSKEESDKLAIILFEKEIYSDIEKLPLDIINSSEKIRRNIIQNNPKYIVKLETLTMAEAQEAISLCPFATVPVLEKEFWTDKERTELTWYHLLTNDYRFEKLPNWQETLTSEMIMFIVSNGTSYVSSVEVEYELLKNHKNFTDAHLFVLLKRDPTAIGMYEPVAEQFGSFYVKFHDDEEKLTDAILELSKDTSLYPALLQPLFTSGRKQIIKYSDFYQSYKATYA